MHVHLVFVTRYRRQIFDYDATEKLRTYFSNVCADFEAELVEMDGEPDHVHLLIKCKNGGQPAGEERTAPVLWFRHTLALLNLDWIA